MHAYYNQWDDLDERLDNEEDDELFIEDVEDNLNPEEIRCPKCWDMGHCDYCGYSD